MAGHAAALQRQTRLKITRLTLLPLAPRWLFLRVETDEGLTGWGEPIDFHGRVHRAMAKALVRELEPIHPLFIEEPVLPEHNDARREIARSTTIPLATGERLYSRWDFKHLLEDGLVDIMVPWLLIPLPYRPAVSSRRDCCCSAVTTGTSCFRAARCHRTVQLGGASRASASGMPCIPLWDAPMSCRIVGATSIRRAG